MNYYYALLESYELLKKRKFHLSILTEDEKKEVVGDDKSERKDMPKEAETAFAGAIERPTGAITPNTQDLVFMKGSGDNSDKTTANGGPFMGFSMKAVTSLQELSTKQWNMVACHYTPDCNHGDNEPKTKDEKIELAVLEDKDKETILGKLDSFFKEKVGVFDPEYVIGTNIVKKTLSVWHSMSDTEKTEELSRSNLIKEVDERITNDVDLTPEKKHEVVQKFGEVLDIYKELNNYEGKIPTGKEGKEFIEKFSKLTGSIQIDHTRGLKINGIYVSWNDHSVTRNHPFSRMAYQMQEAIEDYNLNNVGTKQPRIPRIYGADRRSESQSGGSLYSVRGVVSEIYATIAPQVLRLDQIQTKLKDTNITGAEKKELNAQSEDILKKLKEGIAAANSKGTMERIMAMFGVGLKTINRENLPDAEAASAGEGVEAIRAWFKESSDLSEKAIDFLIEKGGSQLGMGVLIMVMATRHFDKELYGDLEVVSTEHVATEDAELFGVKADIVSHVKCDCSEGESDCSKVAAHFGKLMGDGSPLDLKEYKTNSEDCTVAIPIELKTHNEERNTLAIGQGSSRHLREAVQRAANPKRKGSSAQVVKQNKERDFVIKALKPIQTALGNGETLMETVISFDAELDRQLEFTQPGPKQVELGGFAIEGWKRATEGMDIKDLGDFKWRALAGVTDRAKIAQHAKTELAKTAPNVKDTRQEKTKLRDAKALEYISSHFTRTAYLATLVNMDNTGDTQTKVPKATQVIAAKLAICVGTESSTLRNSRNLTDSSQGLYENNTDVNEISAGLVGDDPKYRATVTGASITISDSSGKSVMRGKIGAAGLEFNKKAADVKRIATPSPKKAEESKDIFMEFLQNQFTMLGTLLNS